MRMLEGRRRATITDRAASYCACVPMPVCITYCACVPMPVCITLWRVCADACVQWRLLRWLWMHQVTPFTIIRLLGPLSRLATRA